MIVYPSLIALVLAVLFCGIAAIQDRDSFWFGWWVGLAIMNFIVGGVCMAWKR